MQPALTPRVDGIHHLGRSRRGEELKVGLPSGGRRGLEAAVDAASQPALPEDRVATLGR